MKSDLCDVEVILLHETAAALKVCVAGDDASNFAWVPKSCCEFERKQAKGNVGTLTLPEHIAIEKGLV